MKTRDRIEALKAEACAAGDEDQVVRCERALTGSDYDYTECVETIAQAALDACETTAESTALLRNLDSALYADADVGRDLTVVGCALAERLGWRVDSDAYGNAFAVEDPTDAA